MRDSDHWEPERPEREPETKKAKKSLRSAFEDAQDEIFTVVGIPRRESRSTEDGIHSCPLLPMPLKYRVKLCIYVSACYPYMLQEIEKFFHFTGAYFPDCRRKVIISLAVNLHSDLFWCSPGLLNHFKTLQSASPTFKRFSDAP